jgi:D-sedoheptulose 7-phosphate isomerase
VTAKFERQEKVFDIRSAPPVKNAAGYFAELASVLHRLPYDTIDQITARLARAYEEDRTVFLFGNGGSAALASHSACDLGKGTAMKGRHRFRVLALTDNIPVMTAWANDARYEDIFAEQLLNFVRKGDVVLAISGSGNSPNILNGLKVGREAGAYTIGLTGYQGGKMKILCDLCLVVPSDNMQFIEDLHTSITHSIFTALRDLITIGPPSLQVVERIAAHRLEPCSSDRTVRTPPYVAEA